MINKKRLLIVLVFVAVILAVMVGTTFLPSFFDSSVISELNFQKGISYRLENHNKDILFINNEEIKSINLSGEEVWSSVTGISDPGVSVKKSYALVSDLQGTVAYLFKNDKLLRKITLNNSILCAKINKRGYVAIVTEEMGYKGMLTVFAPDGKEIYKWHSGSGYIADMDISSQNRVAVSQVNTDGEAIVTRVLHFDIKSNEEVECLKAENVLVSAISFNADESFTALSDTNLYGFNSKGKQKYSVDFGGRTLSYYNIDNMHNIVLAFKGNVNNTVLESYSGSGRLRGVFEAPGQINAVDVNGEVILASVQGDLYSLLPSGKVKFTRDMKYEISSIKIFSNRRKAVLVGGNNVMLYDIN